MRHLSDLYFSSIIYIYIKAKHLKFYKSFCCPLKERMTHKIEKNKNFHFYKEDLN